MIKEMVDAGMATDHEVTFTKAQIEHRFGKATTQYPTGNDKPRPADDNGEIDTEVGGHCTEDVEILDPLSQRVKDLVIAAGGKYVPPQRALKVTPQLVAAFERLEAARPLLMRALEMAERRQYGEAVLNKHFKTDSSASGSASGSQSGSEFGSMSGEVSKTLIGRFMAGDQVAGLKLMGRR